MNGTHSRRDALRIFGGAAAGLWVGGTVVACSSIDDDSTDADATSSPSASPVRGGTLRVGRRQDLTVPDGHAVGNPAFLLLPQVYNTLLRYDATLTPQPELAESWETTPSMDAITLVLRQGVTFHSGRPFTADDVLYNLRRETDLPGTASVNQMKAWASNVEAIDEHTVRLTFGQPTPHMFDMLQYLYIVDQELAETDEAQSRAVGTGPFQLAEWVPGDHYTLVRNENYWRDGYPYLDEVEVTIVPQDDALAIRLESGDVDMIDNISERTAAGLEGTAGVNVLTSEFGGQYYYIGANTTVAPLDDQRVRQAINHAINRSRFAEQLLNGYGAAAAIPWPPHSEAYAAAANEEYAYDLERAADLVEQAGANGATIRMTNNGSFPALSDLAQVLQADLATIGVTLEITNAEQAAWGELLRNGEFDGLWSGVLGFNNFYPATAFAMGIPLRTKNNPSHFASPQYEQLVGQLSAETDEAARQQAEAEATEVLLNESFIMPAARQLRPLATSDKVSGVGYRVTEMTTLEEAWISQ